MRTLLQPAAELCTIQMNSLVPRLLPVFLHGEEPGYEATFPSAIRRSNQIQVSLRRRALDDRAGHGEVLGSDLPSRRSWPARFDAYFLVSQARPNHR